MIIALEYMNDCGLLEVTHIEEDGTAEVQAPVLTASQVEPGVVTISIVSPGEPGEKHHYEPVGSMVLTDVDTGCVCAWNSVQTKGALNGHRLNGGGYSRRPIQ